MAEIVPVRFLERILVSSPWFKRSTYRLFHLLYRNRFSRYVFQGIASAGLVAVAAWLVECLHLPASRLTGVLTWGAPGIAVLVGLAVVELPLGVVGYYERRVKSLDVLLADRLHKIIWDTVPRTRKDHGPQALETGAAISEILAALNGAKGAIHMVTPNAFYMLADRWLPRAEQHVGDAEAQELLRTVSERAKWFRNLLVQFAGPIYCILPDPNVEEVRTYFEQRAIRLGLPASLVRSINRGAAAWARRELARERGRRQTHVHLTKCPPSHRLLLTDEVCFFQELPLKSHGLKEPVYKITAQSHPAVFEKIRFSLRIWSES